MAPQHSGKVLSSVSKCKTAVMYLPEKIHELQCHGCDFNVNESTASIKLVSLNRNTHKTRVCIDCWKCCAQRLRDAPCVSSLSHDSQASLIQCSRPLYRT